MKRKPAEAKAMERPVGTRSLRIDGGRPGPSTVAALAFVAAVVTGFGVIVVGNDLGLALADPSADRTVIFGPLMVFLCAPLAVIVGASSLASVTGLRHPASALASVAVLFGTAAGAGTGRVVWRFLERQTYGGIVGQLDSPALLTVAGSVLLGGVAGALIGDRLRSRAQAKRVSQWSSIVATALLTYPTLELIAGRAEVATRQLWMLAFMLFALALAPRIGLSSAEGLDSGLELLQGGERDQNSAVRLLVGFSAGWMTSILVNMSGVAYDGQLTRYILAWTLPLLLMAPGVLAHLDGIGQPKALQPAVVETFNR